MMSVRNVLMRWFILRPTKTVYRIFHPGALLLRFFIDTASLPGRIPPFGVKRERCDFGGIPGTKFTPKKNHNEKQIMVYLHGGGYSFGSSRTTHRALIANLAKKMSVVSFGVDYRLTPEYPYPAAFDDAGIAWDAIVSANPDKEIVLAGDSAGGGLSLALMMELKRSSRQLPAMCVLLSPWTDLTLSGESIETHKKRDPYLTQRILQMYSSLYCVDIDTNDWRVSPLFGDYSGLPPTLVMVGDRELLLDDSLRIKEFSSNSGMELEVDVWAEMVHVWMGFIPFIPEGKKAISRIAQWVELHSNIDSND